MTSKVDTPINAENGGVITKKDLVRMFWRSLPMEFSWHYERQMHMGFEFMIGPALKKIRSIQENCCFRLSYSAKIP